MDEKKMAEEFAKIWKAVGESSGAIIETNKDFKKYAKRQNVAILAGIGGFLYLCKKIQKLEDVTKKE